MHIRFGNLTLEQFITTTSADFTTAETQRLNELRRDQADVAGSGGFHVFADPLTVVIDTAVADEIIAILTTANTRREFDTRVSIEQVDAWKTVARAEHETSLVLIQRSVVDGTFSVLERDVTYPRITPVTTALNKPDVRTIVPMETAAALSLAHSFESPSSAAGRQFHAARADAAKTCASVEPERHTHASARYIVPCSTCSADWFEPCINTAYATANSWSHRYAPMTGAHKARRDASHLASIIAKR